MTYVRHVAKTMLCSKCEGVGLVERKTCPMCHGYGVGLILEGRFIYAAINLSWPIIVLRRLRQMVYAVGDFAIFMVGLLGLTALLWWYVADPSSFGEMNRYMFWRQKNWLLLIFWISLLFDMLLWYRVRQRAYAKQKISRFKKFSEQAADWNIVDKLPKINAAAALSEGLILVMEKTYLLAARLKISQLTVMQLAYCLLSNHREILALFGRLNVDLEKMLDKIGHQLARSRQSADSSFLSVDLKKALVEAYAVAYENNHQQVKAVDILRPIWQNDKILAEIFYDLSVDEGKLQNTIAWSQVNDRLIANYHLYKKMARFKPASAMNRAYTAIATPLLDHFSFDLTLRAKFGYLDVCVGREQETEEIFEQLRSGRRGLVLVGEEGVGKNAIVENLAQLMVLESVPEMLRDKRLVEVDLARLLGGATAAEAQERMLGILNEVTRSGNIILYLPAIESLSGLSVGSGDSLDLSEIVASAINRQGVFVVATSGAESYRRSLERGPLGQALARVEVAEPEGNAAIQMIESKIVYLENKFKVFYTYEALSEAVKLSSRYLHEQFLPAKAIVVLEKAGAEAANDQSGRPVVDGRAVAQAISQSAHVPATQVSQSESQLLLDLEAKIHERLIGQEAAVKMVAESLRRARVELREGKRPIANFLFLGPTGVGKTELAKAIAAIYFGDEDYMIRLDMSEYQLPESLNKMIGSEGQSGYLTEKVRQAPSSLILLDEIEKAHPDILNVFLQVMDDGRLTDGRGRTIDFTNAIIIATSNIGAVYIQEQLRAGLDVANIQAAVIDKYLVEKMRPELINRFDGIIVFKPLSLEEVAAVAGLLLNKTKQLLSDKGINLVVSQSGLQILAQAGWQPEFGARPLRRLLQDKIDNVVATKLLSNELARRDTVEIDDQAEIVVHKAEKL